MNTTPATGPSETSAIQVQPESVGERLDVYLARRLDGASRSRIRDLIVSGTVLLNGSPARPATKLRSGDTVTFPSLAPSRPPPAPEPEDIPLQIVYEDEDLVVLDKPAGMVVHPSVGHASGTLVHALLARYPELRSERGDRPGIVHRLDKDTSGLMLVARNDRSLRYLQDLLRGRQVLKEYTLLCCGALNPPAGRIEARVGRDPRSPLKMAVVSGGREALTEYETLTHLGPYALTLARLHTGRTHQIRVHFAAVGHPLAGDQAYGKCAAPQLDRQFLHSSRLGFTLPGGQDVQFASPLPADLQRTLSLIRSG